jgi:hypothetical protein
VSHARILAGPATSLPVYRPAVSTAHNRHISEVALLVSAHLLGVRVMDLPQGCRAVDAAVLAGAGYLQSTSVSEPQAVSVTVSYVEKN